MAFKPAERQKQTSEQILQDFPEFCRQTVEIWYSGATQQDNLWGADEDLRCNILFMTNVGIKVANVYCWSRNIQFWKKKKEKEITSERSSPLHCHCIWIWDCFQKLCDGHDCSISYVMASWHMQPWQSFINSLCNKILRALFLSSSLKW